MLFLNMFAKVYNSEKSLDNFEKVLFFKFIENFIETFFALNLGA